MRTTTIMICVCGMLACATQAETIHYGGVTFYPPYSAGHYSDVWDLTRSDLVLTYSIDLSAVTQTSSSETPYVEVGIRQVGAGDFNPGPWNTYQGGAGGWMTSLVGDLATNPNLLDLDDKHNLSASGGRDERDYDVYASDPGTVVSPPFGGYDTAYIWFDRDGVDPWQDTKGANTGGTYNITIVYHAITPTLGSMIATINGNGVDIVNQLIRVEGTYYPAGLSFTGDMTQMQVFAGAWWTSGAGGFVSVSDITASGTLIPEPATLSLLTLGGLLLRRRRRCS
ncbi:MAG TPA: PEP-CTERM sorting domain-containing protein [Phycisphaerae bacterium]|nr:PEP-CTERM sorting domain-containing protein [Phycisphaerae bacterium]